MYNIVSAEECIVTVFAIAMLAALFLQGCATSESTREEKNTAGVERPTDYRGNREPPLKQSSDNQDSGKASFASSEYKGTHKEYQCALETGVKGEIISFSFYATPNYGVALLQEIEDAIGVVFSEGVAIAVLMQSGSMASSLTGIEYPLIVVSLGNHPVREGTVEAVFWTSYGIEKYRIILVAAARSK